MNGKLGAILDLKANHKISKKSKLNTTLRLSTKLSLKIDRLLFATMAI